MLDVWRGTLRLTKLKFQNRVRTVIVLVRLDVDGAPHTNPDGQRLSGTHLHLFREGYDDRWAFPVDPGSFTLLNDPGATFQEFCAFCKIRVPTTSPRNNCMNRAECQKLIDGYIGWLRQGISVEALGESCELTTPFLDRHNDHLQVYATRRNGTVVLSDDGYVLSDLRTSGLELDTPKRKMISSSRAIAWKHFCERRRICSPPASAMKQTQLDPCAGRVLVRRGQDYCLWPPSAAKTEQISFSRY